MDIFEERDFYSNDPALRRGKTQAEVCFLFPSFFSFLYFNLSFDFFVYFHYCSLIILISCINLIIQIESLGVGVPAEFKEGVIARVTDKGNYSICRYYIHTHIHIHINFSCPLVLFFIYFINHHYNRLVESR